MTRKFTKEDLDRLLDLVGQSPVLGASAEPFLTGASSQARVLWSANERHWEQELRAATEDVWSDQQYLDAARLLCTAEHQQMVFKQFAGALDDIAPGTWEPRLVWSRPEPSTDEALSSDQIVLAPAQDADASLHASDDAQVRDIEIALAANGSSALPLYAPANGAHVAEESMVGAAGLADEDRGAARPVFNAVRANLFLQSGLSLAKPYDGWADFKARNDLPDDIVVDLKVAYPDGFHKLDLWIGALVESSYQANVDATVEALLARYTSEIALDYNYDALQLLVGTGIADGIDQGRLSDLLPRLRGSGPHDPVEDSELHDALDALAPIIVGTDGDDVLFGTNGDDVMLGGAGNDRMFGGDGDDLLIGEEGDDVLDGGAGDDVLDGGAGDDVLLGGDGRDILIGGDGDDILDGGDGDDVLYGDSSDDTENEPLVEGIVAIGSSKDDVIGGGAGDDLIDGGGGRDVLIGGDGNDTLFGGRGDDILIGGDGDDILDGGRDKDTMVGGAGNDVYIVDNAGDVVIELVDQGFDTIATTLSALTLPDNVEVLVYTGSGDFAGTGNSSDNVIVGGSGDDVLMGCEGDDILMGGEGDDVLLGGDGNDILFGGSGLNHIEGGDCDDVVYSGTGDDYIIFTRGNDTVVLMPGFGNDVLEGFKVDSSGSGSRHRIDVSAYDFDSDALGRDILLIYTDEGTTVQIGNDSLLLVMVDIDEIDKGNFIF